jgi:hypothetical protein
MAKENNSDLAVNLHKRAEEILAEKHLPAVKESPRSEEQYRLMLENSRDVIYTLDAEGTGDEKQDYFYYPGRRQSRYCGVSFS